jgi:hypothetical protein
LWKGEGVADALESCANQHQIEMKFGGARQSMSLGISTIDHLQHLQPSFSPPAKVQQCGCPKHSHSGAVRCCGTAQLNVFQDFKSGMS